MQHRLRIFEVRLSTAAQESATQLGLRNKNRVKGHFDMSMDAVDYRSSHEDEPKRDDDAQTSQMTPVRRAALDALEREFSELLKRRPR